MIFGLWNKDMNKNFGIQQVIKGLNTTTTSFSPSPIRFDGELTPETSVS